MHELLTSVTACA